MSNPTTLQIIGSSRPGGAENFFLRLHQALNRAGMQSVAITRSGSELTSLVDGPGDTARMESVFDPLSRWSLARVIRRHRPDIVQTWMGRATRLVHLRAGRRPAHVARLGGFYNPAHYRHAHALVGNTRGICDFLIREGIPAERVYHIGNFVPRPDPVSAEVLTDWRMRLGLDSDALVVLGLGRLHPNKGFDILVEAFGHMPREIDGRPVHLLLAGDGPLAASIDQQIADSPACSRIHRLGWQQHTDPLYALADLFVCPSRHEPLGNVILEAWTHGCPVVTTATDGALELVTPGVDGLMVPIDQAGPMAASMEAVLAMPRSERAALAEAGSAALEKSHGERVVVEQYRSLYGDLIASWI